MPSRPTDARFRVLRRVTGAALAAVLCACAWCYGVLFIEGGSMAPAMHAGDVVVFRRVSVAPAAGEIVVFEHRGSLVVHRVVGVLKGGRVRTKGDANTSLDPWPVDEEAVRGEVVLVLPIGGLAARLAGDSH